MTKWSLSAVLLLAAVASAFSAIALKFENMMRHDFAPYDAVLLATLGAIAALTVAGLALARGRDANSARRRLLAFTALVIAAGAAPRMILALERGVEQARTERTEQAKDAAELAERKADIEARIAAGTSYSPDEAMRFVKYVEESGHPPYNSAAVMAGAFALLDRALSGKVIDPNMIVKDRLRADLGPEPLFIHYHRWIRQDPRRTVRAWDWRVMVRLARNADLSTPEAARAAADLRKTAMPLHDGLYFELK
jgi:hypothetical protein